MKSMWMSLMLALALAGSANAQQPGIQDPRLDDPILDESEADDPLLQDPYFKDPAMKDPGVGRPVAQPGREGDVDRPRYRRTPADKTLTVQEVFAIMDSDKNGVIDQAEWRQQSMTVFYVRDADEDTRLSRDEVPGLTADAFKRIDLNGDGFIGGYEFNQSELNSFDAANADKSADGVSQAELATFLGRFTGPSKN